MNKFDFINDLKEKLKGHVSDSVLDAKIEYYENYINDEINKGRNENDVINELGDPKLIAKTIIDLDDNAGNNIYNDNARSENSDNTNRTFNRRYNNFNLGCGLSSILLIIIILTILQFMGIILRGTFYMFGGSGIFIVIIILILYNMFKNRSS